MGRTQSGKREPRRWRRWQLCAMAVCVVVFVVSGTMALRDVLRARREHQANLALAEQVNAVKRALAEQTPQKIPGATEPPKASGAEGPQEPPAEIFEEPVIYYDENGILLQYSALYQRNADLRGWLSIDGTGIDYPVMYAPDRKEYYLHRGFDGQYAASGCLFIDEDCDPESNHQLIYGHHMNNGSMFGTLPDYADPAFGAQHPVIAFDTMWEEGSYELLGAFYATVYSPGEKGGFRYYQFEDLSDPSRFDEYVTQVKAAALYDTGVEAKYGDSLLTLSTCSYHTANGRFVVVARKIN